MKAATVPADREVAGLAAQSPVGRAYRRLGWLIGAAALAYVFLARLDWDTLLATLASCDWTKAPWILAVQLVFVALGGLSLWLLTVGRYGIPLPAFLGAYWKCVALGYWTPAATGELSLAWFLRPHGVPLRHGLALVTLDKLVTTLAFALVALPAGGWIAARLASAVDHRTAGLAWLAAIGVLFAAALWVAAIRASSRGLFSRFLERGRRYLSSVGSFVLASPGRLAANFTLTILRVVTGAGALWLSLDAFAPMDNVSFSRIVVAASAARLLALALPSPNGLGVYEVALVELLSPATIPAADVLAGGLLSRAIALPVIGLGLLIPVSRTPRIADESVAAARGEGIRQGAVAMNGPLPATGERLVPEELHSLEDYLLYLRQLFAYQVVERFVPQDARLLEVGVGAGYGLRWLAERHRGLTGVDVHAPAVLHAARRTAGTHASLVTAHACHLPFSSGSFDAVISFQVIEHLEDDGGFVAEVARLLRPGGVALLTTPNRALRLAPGQRPWNRFHKREYSAEDLRRVLEPAFARVEVIGVDVRGEARRVELDRLRRIRRLVRVDPLELRRYLVPLLSAPFRRSGYRLGWPRRAQDGAASWASCHSLADWFLEADDAGSGLDLLAVCRVRRAPGEAAG